MKIVLIIYCTLTILFVGGCGLLLGGMGVAQESNGVLFLGQFVVAVIFNVAFIVLVNSGSANRQRNLKVAAIAYLAIGAASVLLLALLTNSQDTIPLDLAELIVFLIVVKAVFVYAIGSRAPAK